jgi:hypothetical protein
MLSFTISFRPLDGLVTREGGKFAPEGEVASRFLVDDLLAETDPQLKLQVRITCNS